jgi:inosose dehydratase
MDALQEMAYTDWITIEIDVSLTTPKESLSICRDYLLNRLELSL